MPLKASDLPWWKWLLIAAIAAAISGFTFVALMATNNSPAAKTFPILFPILNENPLVSVIVMLLGALVAASCTIVGTIRLIKWAFEDGVAETDWRSENRTRSLKERLMGFETGHRELNEIKENLRELESRLEQLLETRERESDERKEKISSHYFELLDKEGRERARLETSSDGQPRLALYDEKGVHRASLSLNEDGYPKLQLTNLDWDRISSIGEDGSNRGRILLGFDDEGYPQLLMHDAEVGGFDPALALAVRKAEWLGVGEVGVGETRYRSKTAFLACDAWLGAKHEGKFFAARVVEPAPDEDA